MTEQTYSIVAVETDGDEDSGFTVKFDRLYDIRNERFPVSSNAATRAVEDAYDWGYDPREMEEREEVGKLVVENREYVRTYCTK